MFYAQILYSKNCPMGLSKEHIKAKYSIYKIKSKVHA